MIWIIYILGDAIGNWWWIEKKKSVPNYIMLTLFRGIAAIIYGAIIDTVEGEMLQWFLFTSCSFWLLFDVTINLLRKKSIFYRGENSKIDRFGNAYPVLYFIAKGLAVIGLIYSIMQYLQ